MKNNQIILLTIIVFLIVLFFILDVQHYMTLEYFQVQRSEIISFYDVHPWQTMLIFFAMYIIMTGLSLPGATLLTLIAGALFGLLVGTILVSFASSIGGTLAFLFSRYLFKDAIQKRFKQQLTPINRGIEKEGAFYLFTLRLVPIFPFFIINLAMALTPIKTWTFYWVSQIGMLLATIIYVNAGMQINNIESLGDILSQNLIFSLILIGIFPLIAKKVLNYIKASKKKDFFE